ncbi:MAG: hypothetical protein GWP09_01090 [Nitrospiraceae bacterium]|nr:hypothetical protein [Nitrospiraceae bacterium]
MVINRKIASDKPLSSITLRKYENPKYLEGRELIKRLCLSLGLLQPGDSRDIIVDILFLFIKNKRGSFTPTEINTEVYKIRDKENLSLLGISPSNILRQIRRLKELNIIMKREGRYLLKEESISEIFNTQIERFIIKPIIERIDQYCERIDNLEESNSNNDKEENVDNNENKAADKKEYLEK